MDHYVTLFDSLFMPQGLALHMSMERHLKDYTLWILCVDDDAHNVLTKMNLTNVKLLKLSLLETPELLRVKKIRSKGEYCWTLTPFAPRFVFNANRDVDRVTYVDSDVWFLKSPSVAFTELVESKKSVLITKHAYHPEYDFSSSSGIYCVQFMTFLRDSSESVLNWWQERCIEWCYAKYEDGKFGDQMYLNSWSELFQDKVHVLSYGGYTLAPWNVQRYPLSDGFLYHFQGLRILKRSRVLLAPPLTMPQSVIKEVYLKYLIDLKLVIKELALIGHIVQSQRSEVTVLERVVGVGRELKRLFYKIGIIRVFRI